MTISNPTFYVNFSLVYLKHLCSSNSNSATNVFHLRYTSPSSPSKYTWEFYYLSSISALISPAYYFKHPTKILLLDQKPEIIFFTGDLVNFRPSEVDDYIDILKQIKAPLGVYSVLGNHDYGFSASLGKKDITEIASKHKLLGWDLLLNENRTIQRGKDKIAILGVENWGDGRFPKYGKLDQAYQGTKAASVKLLLSHDPSHWEAQVTKNYKDIDVTFSGHTHGAQFGIEMRPFKWSPVKYRYKQWAGLYKQAKQYLYVNRGFGYIGYLGRVGMLPEVGIIQLTSS